MTNTTFEDFLQDKHAAQYQGLDDEMGEDYEEWLSELDIDTWLEYGQAYSEAKALEAFNKYAEKHPDFPWTSVPAKFSPLNTPLPKKTMTNIEELRKKVQSAKLTTEDYGCDGLDECCRSCGGERLDEEKVLFFLQQEIEAAEKAKVEEVIAYVKNTPHKIKNYKYKKKLHKNI